MSEQQPDTARVVARELHVACSGSLSSSPPVDGDAWIATIAHEQGAQVAVAYGLGAESASGGDPLAGGVDPVRAGALAERIADNPSVSSGVGS